MTLRLSSELRAQLMGKRIKYVQPATIESEATAKYLDSAGGFLTTGFRAGMVILVSGFVTETDNNQWAHITSVKADGTEMVVVVTVALVTDNGDETDTITLWAEAQSLCDILAHGVMRIYTGSQPADADTAPSGTLLLEITKGSGEFGAGFTTNSLEFDEPTTGVLGKKDADTWSDAGLATGTAGWFRYFANDFDTGASALCFDGAVATSGAELNLSSTAIVLGATTTIDEFEITMPASP